MYGFRALKYQTAHQVRARVGNLEMSTILNACVRYEVFVEDADLVECDDVMWPYFTRIFE